LATEVARDALGWPAAAKAASAGLRTGIVRLIVLFRLTGAGDPMHESEAGCMHPSRSSAPFRFSRRAPAQMAVGMLLALALLVSGCAGGSTGPAAGQSFQETCLADKPELRFWMRDVIAVAIRLPASVTSTDDAIGKAVATRIAQLPEVQQHEAPPTLTPLSDVPFIRVGQNATAFYRVSGNNTSSGCETRLISVVNGINRALNPTPTDPAVPQAMTTLHPLPVSAGQDTATIVGASPDWIFAGTPYGGDSGGGHPAGPPRAPIAPFSLGDARDVAYPSATQRDGSGTAVVVLDTGYQLPGGHSDFAPCSASTGQLCVPKAQPITGAPGMSGPLSATTPPFAGLVDVLQESDLKLETDTPVDITANGASGSAARGVSQVAPPYELTDASGVPLDIRDHGFFISGLIHEAAPAAQIRLVRVLNDFGIGDLHSILVALQTVANSPEQLNIKQGTPLVINMSLSFGPPANCLVGVWDNWGQIQQEEDAALQKQGADPTKWQHYTLPCPQRFSGPASQLAVGGGGAHAALSLPLSLLVSSLAGTKGISVVAATGNESTATQRLDADLPASICGVIPAAATNAGTIGKLAAGGSLAYSDGLLVSFSNRPFLSGSGPSCLRMQQHGDVTGDLLVTLAPLTGPSALATGVNVCGIFLQPIPPSGGTGAPSPTNLALWDGTSFATGFVSGSIAREGTPASGLSAVPDRQPCNGPA
jgi:hypothetical protein